MMLYGGIVLRFTKDSFIKNLAHGKLLVPYLDRYDKWDQPFEFKYTPKEGDDAWHPSGDCTPSVQALYDKAIGVLVENSHAPSLQRTFLVGHFWHQVIQNVLVDMGLAELSAIECRGSKVWGPKLELWHDDERDRPSIAYGAPYHWCTGSGDVAPLILPNLWKGILDIKTMGKRDFETAQKTGLLPERFDAKYECQINIYMALFEQEHGMILGVNKDSPHNFIEFVYDRNQELVDTIFAKWEYVSEHLDEGVPPVPDADELFPLSLKGPVG